MINYRKVKFLPIAERSYARAGVAFAGEKCDPTFERLAPGFRRFARAV